MCTQPLRILLHNNWGSPYDHWKWIHWIRILDPDSMWVSVSYTLHADYMHCTAGLDLTHCPGALESRLRLCEGKLVFGSRSPIWSCVESPIDTRHKNPATKSPGYVRPTKQVKMQYVQA